MADGTVRCASCNHENRPGAKFCEECAAPLKHVCASCDVELRPAAKFCDECGRRQPQQVDLNARARPKPPERAK